MSSGKVLLGVLAGIAAGAALGILFAPDHGKNTRRKISKKGDDYVEDLKLKFEDFIDGITEKLDSAKEEADDLISKGKSKAQEVKTDFNNAVN